MGRILDALAIAAIAFVAWKFLVAPRVLGSATAFPAPHATYPRLDGATFRVTDERGRVLFLDFYASWCEPCKIELPLVEAWAKAHPQAVVVPVDVGEPRGVAAAFAAEHGLGNVALDPNSNATPLFAVRGFPTVVVVDPSGHIRATWEGLNPAIAMAMDNAEKQLAPR